jgi:hypothetical protein
MKIEYGPDLSDVLRRIIASMQRYGVHLALTADALPLARPFHGKDVFIVGTTFGPGSMCQDELCMTFKLLGDIEMYSFVV